MKKSRDLEFLFEIGSIRHMQRAWAHFGIPNTASDVEHTFRVVFLALLIARREKKGDEALIMKMALIHDLAESRTGDHDYIQKVYIEEKDEEAFEHMVADTSFADMQAIYEQYNKRECIEAKIVKDADNLDIDLEMKELEEAGTTLAKKWKPSREIVKKKLYTKTAQEIWDEIQTADPAAWHLLSNKWYKQPKAGF